MLTIILIPNIKASKKQVVKCLFFTLLIDFSILILTV